MVYKEKDAQLEDNRSTAYTFLGVGIAGLIFVILFALDIIKLPMADYMRVIMIVVMSVLFVIFLGIGITHFRKFNQMSADADMESRRTSEIMEWFSSNYTAEEIDHVSGADSEPSMEQRYFIRSDKIAALLHAKFAGLPEDYEEHILEKIYAAYYSDNNE